MKKSSISLIVLLSSLLTACGGITSSITSQGPTYVGNDELGGGQVDTDVDNFDDDVTALKTYLEKLHTFKTYTYETTYNYNYQGMALTGKVVDYYGEKFFYEENVSSPRDSFGMAEEKDSKNVFYFYANENEGEVIATPSLYEYTSVTGENIYPMTELFGALGVAGLHNLQGEAIDDLTGLKISENEYQITAETTYNVFQFMTQRGSAISTLMDKCTLEIINPDTYETRITISLGTDGEIVSILKPMDETKYSFVDDLLSSGEMKGVAYYQDVATLFEDVLSKDNYTVTTSYIDEGIASDENSSSVFKVYNNENFFLIDYSEQENKAGRTDYGRMYLPAGTEVDLYTLSFEFDNTGNVTSINKTLKETKCLDYSACYEFDIVNNEVVFTNFIGPNESEDLIIIEVEKYSDLSSLSSDQLGNEFVYVVKEENKAYIYQVVDGATGEIGFTFFDDWFGSVGDFLLSYDATFYTSSTVFGELGRYYFEQDISDENHYFSRNDDVITMICETLFGYAFGGVPTGIAYVYQVDLNIEKDGDNNITSCDFTIHFELPENSSFTITLDNLNSTSIPNVENAYNSLIGGLN